jgi:hypothetical protein
MLWRRQGDHEDDNDHCSQFSSSANEILDLESIRRILDLESIRRQAGLPNLPRTRAESADQAAPSLGAREAAAIGRADRDQPKLVDGLHA